MDGLVVNWEERQLQAALIQQAQTQLAAQVPAESLAVPETRGLSRTAEPPALPLAADSHSSEVSARSRLSSPVGELRTGSQVEVILNGVVCQAQVNAQGKIEVMSVQTEAGDALLAPKVQVESPSLEGPQPFLPFSPASCKAPSVDALFGPRPPPQHAADSPPGTPPR